MANDKRIPHIVSRKGLYEPVKILHWGIEYEELNNGVGQYTIVYVLKEDGFIESVAPCEIKYIDTTVTVTPF